MLHFPSAGGMLSALDPTAIARATRDSVHAAFAAIARAQPEAPAIIDESGRLSYRALAAAAAEVHGLLVSRGVQPGRGVGVWCEEPRRQIAAMLGVLRSGDHYVALDADYPEQRLRDILADGAVEVVLADPAAVTRVRALTDGKLAVLCWSGAAPEAALAPVAVDSRRLAYVTYTSGTTGRPKGVMHTHANILHEAAVHRAILQLGAEDRASLLYSPSVIGAVRDIFGPLLSGGAVCPFPFKRRGFAALKEWLRAQGVTQLHAVPVLFRELIATLGPEECLPAVRTVFVAGDRVLPEDVRSFRRHFAPAARFYTGIGASEANSIYTHWFVDGRAELGGENLPTGWPLPHKEVRILDEQGGPARRGESGEIVVCSEYLALGYWRRPELSAAAFGEEADGTGRRTYRTGDVGRFDAEGRLVHLGRRDQQLKINGERIELAEIERALLAAPGVRAAAVRAFAPAGATDRPRLVAYVVAEPGAAGDEGAVRAELIRRLSPSARPGRIVWLTALPLTPNGKVDRTALPDPAATSGAAESEGERSTTERVVHALWREALPQAAAGSGAESFEQLGGDSLQAVRLALLLRQRCAVEWPTGLALREATVARLVAHVESTSAVGGAPELDRFQLLAAAGRMEELGRRLAPELPVYLAGEGLPGPVVVWFGIHGRGLRIGAELARLRPVYFVPALSPSAATRAGDIDRAVAFLAQRLAPLLPERVTTGGLCTSGLQAMMFARALEKCGRPRPRLLMVDAFGAPRFWRWLVRLPIVWFRMQRARELGWWRVLCEDWNKHVSPRFRARAPAAQRPSVDVSPAASSAAMAASADPGIEPLLALLAGEDPGEILLGLSRSSAWMRIVSPRLGWRRARLRYFSLPFGHMELWAAGNLARVAATIERALRANGA